jgi:hypothetical protein
MYVGLLLRVVKLLSANNLLTVRHTFVKQTIENRLPTFILVCGAASGRIDFSTSKRFEVSQKRQWSVNWKPILNIQDCPIPRNFIS